MLPSPAPLHIPDGFLSPAVAAVGWVIALGVIILAGRRTRRQLGDRLVPMMGVLAAFLFAAQAVNFPVAGGTSGHLIGAALAAILLGPWASALVMTSVVVVQGVLFQDGGLIVMGWNVINMAVVGGFSGHAAYRLARRLGGASRPATMAAGFAAGWISVLAAALATAIELAASGTVPLAVATTAMASIHALIGIGEGVITAAAVGLLLAARPEFLQARDVPGVRSATLVLVGLSAALLVAAISPLASRAPDGLQAVAAEAGFLGLAVSGPAAPLPGYRVPSLADPALATMAAVGLGALVVFAAAVTIGRLATLRAGREAPETPPSSR